MTHEQVATWIEHIPWNQEIFPYTAISIAKELLADAKEGLLAAAMDPANNARKQEEHRDVFLEIGRLEATLQALKNVDGE